VFEIQITKLPVKVKEIVKILYVVVIGIPNSVVFIPWNWPGCSPPVLQFFEMLISGIDIFLNVQQPFNSSMISRRLSRFLLGPV
jgi:hypothetical protein